jgi:hypothetical protein
MSLLSYNESIAVCAQQENPFVQSKPYNPDHVFGWVVAYLLGGEAPLTTEEIDHATAVYTATIETLIGKGLSVTESTVIEHKAEILAYVDTLLSEGQTGQTVQFTAVASKTEAWLVAASEDYFEVQGIRIKKQWVCIAAAIILLLLILKFFK